ncbi:hypothetical protein BGX20_003594 [Mortierella sp. AD010]|nr:hypothetical protein BGX20_003594 [Mortierella sp. AD010]
MSGISPNRSRSPPPPPPPPRNGATSPSPASGQPTRTPLQPITTAGLPNKTRQPPGVPGTPPPVPGSGPLLRSGSVTNKPDARPMSPVSTGPKLEPSATEGRWTFRSAVDFPIPPQPISNPGKICLRWLEYRQDGCRHRHL